MKGKRYGIIPPNQKFPQRLNRKAVRKISKLLLSATSYEHTELKVVDKVFMAVFGFDFPLCCLNTFTLKMYFSEFKNVNHEI